MTLHNLNRKNSALVNLMVSYLSNYQIKIIKNFQPIIPVSWMLTFSQRTSTVWWRSEGGGLGIGCKWANGEWGDVGGWGFL